MRTHGFSLTYQHSCGCCWPTCDPGCTHSSKNPVCSHICVCSSGSGHTRLCLQGDTHPQGHEDMGDKSDHIRWRTKTQQPLHVLRRRRRHVTNPHSGHLSAGSPRDTGRCRSLWCCSMSVHYHKCVGQSHIHLCLQQTRTNKHWQLATHKCTGDHVSGNKQLCLDYMSSVICHAWTAFLTQSNLWSRRASHHTRAKYTCSHREHAIK